MTVMLSPFAGVGQQLLDNSGNVLSGGLIYTYAAGTTTPLSCYTSASGVSAHSNPIVLTSAGRVPSGEIWLTDGVQYKFVLQTSTGVTIGTYDNITGINSNFVNYTNQQEIQTATSGQTVFTLTTMQYQPGTGSLSVFVDGVNQYGPSASYAFTETNSTTVTFNNGLHVGAQVKFTTSAINASSYGDAFQISYTPPFTSSVPTNVGAKLAQSVSVLDFGADSTGVADSTQAFQNAINYGIANNLQVNIPNGNYKIDSVQIKDAVYNFTLHSDNALIQGTATTPQRGLFDVVNCVDFHMTGSWHINGVNNSNYETGLCIRAQAGTSQATTRINVYNPTFRNFQIGIGVGQYNLDYQCSEINIFGANFFSCPVAVYNAGSQTGASYNGCNLISEINAAFSGSVCRAIWMEGGFVTVNGGSIVNAVSTTGQTILFNPASSVTYSNPYGLLRVNGAHIETASQLAVVTNSRSLSTPLSDTSNITFTTVGGYVSPSIATQDFIVVIDSSYQGYIQVANSNFYTTSLRTQYNIASASSDTKVQVDKSSFNKNFMGWLDGVSGGKLLHNLELIVQAYGINTTIGTGEKIIKFLNNSGSTLRYGLNYSTSTGLFTVPNGGFKTLTIQTNIIGASAVTGDMYVKLNGNIVGFGQYSNKGTLNVTLQNLNVGDTIGVYLNQSSSNAFDNGFYQLLNISAETK